MIMDFSPFEVAGIIVTLASGAGNLIQYVLARKAKSLHISDIENIYSTAYRSIENLDHALKAAEDKDIVECKRYSYATAVAVNTIREKCQNRIMHLEHRKLILRPPWDADRQGQ